MKIISILKMTHVWHRKAAVGIHLIIWPHSPMASCSRHDHRKCKGSAGGSVCVLRAAIRASTLSSCNEAWLTHSILLNTRQGNVVRATCMAFCFQLFTKIESSYSNGRTKTGSALHFCHPADFSPSSPLWTRLCQALQFLFTVPPLQCYHCNHHQYPNLAVPHSAHSLCLGTPLSGEFADTTTVDCRLACLLNWFEW